MDGCRRGRYIAQIAGTEAKEGAEVLYGDVKGNGSFSREYVIFFVHETRKGRETTDQELRSRLSFSLRLLFNIFRMFLCVSKDFMYLLYSTQFLAFFLFLFLTI